MNSFSHQHVFEFKKKQLVTIGFPDGDKLLEFEGKDHTCCGDGKAHVVIGIVGVHDVLFNIFAYQEADGLKELTHILLNLYVVDAEGELAPLAIEGKTDLSCEQLIHSKYSDGQI